MYRILIPVVGVVSLWAVASAVTRRRSVAVAAGAALAFAVFLLAAGGLAGSEWQELATFGGVTGGLLLLARAQARERRDGARGGAGAAAHWRGEVPVWRALALVGALLAAFAYVAGGLGAAPMYPRPRLVSAAIVLAWGAAIPAGVWALVGTWRAAGAHGRRGRLRALGWGAKLLVAALSPLLALAVAWDGVPDLREYSRIALGPSERSQYAIRLLRDGRELELSGRLGFGAGDDLEAALAAAPDVRVLHLDSPGGRTFEGERVAALVAARGLSTYVARECSSACVLAFAAGKERLLGRSAAVGLHRPSGHGLTRSALDRGAARIAEALVARGVDRRFVERGLATAATELWRPAHEEVLASRLATRRARPSDVALSGATAEDLERLPLKLREDAFFQALYEFERPVFDRVVEGMREGYRLGRPASEVLAFVDVEMERILAQDLPRTSDAAARAFLETMLALARELRERDPAACAAYLDGRGGAQARAVTSAADGGVLATVAKVLVAARLEPRPVPATGEVRPLLLAVVAAAEAKEPAVETMDAPDAARRSPEAYCRAVIAVASEIVRLAPEQGGPLVRWMVAR